MTCLGHSSWKLVGAAGVGLALGCGTTTVEFGGSGAGNAAGGAGQGGSGDQGGQGGHGGAACTPLFELCNGVDDDCDGQVDEDCSCVEGEERACYTGDPATEGVGTCKGGTQQCTETGVFGDCEGEVTPAEEQCNGLDDDCDGEIDQDQEELMCGVGACQVTVPSCVDGEAQTCVPGEPAPETCDGVDNDCDGSVDQGCECIDGQSQACYSGAPATKNVGVCKEGTQLCAGGKWGACTGDTLPSSEICDGKDNDCDGQSDEGISGSCDTGGNGVCKAGQISCQNGLLSCVQTTQPSSEKCDGLDNDCDGSADEGNPGGGASCNTGQPGACALGTVTCQNGKLGCVPVNQPSTEICNNLDDDCDGVVDDGNPGGGNGCSTGKAGVCAAGTTTCSGGQLSCVQSQQPNPEICNGLDDDCDGQTDEGNPGGGNGCNTGKAGVCAAGTTSCSGGQVQCVQNQQPGAESCNGLDDDCDGQVDENNPGGGGNCSTGKPGICSAGTMTCQNGSLGCVQNQQPKTEQCNNNLDDDCDGQVDEGCGMCAVVDVALGGHHTCARKQDGTIWCWGNNTYGQLGDGTTASKSSPVQVAALGTTAVEVALGWTHTCARKQDGTIWCWGHNAYGQLGDGTNDATSSPVQVKVIGNASIEVGLGLFHTCARKQDGTVWCWGYNTYGQVGDGTTVNKASPVQVAVLGAAAVELALGGQHTCARKQDGTAWCWGRNLYGQLGDGTTVNKSSPVEVTALGTTAVEVGLGGQHSCARRQDGTVWCWGYNTYGQLGDGTTGDKSSPVQVAALGTAATPVAPGGWHTCARKQDGTLWCWGNNTSGELGDGTTVNKSSPVQVPALGTTAVGAAAGGYHTCARKQDGTLWCWGRNFYGQLGDGTVTNKTSPVKVPLCP